MNNIQYCVEKNTEFLKVVDRNKILEYWNGKRCDSRECLLSIKKGKVEIYNDHHPKIKKRTREGRIHAYKKLFSRLAKDNHHWDFVFIYMTADSIQCDDDIPRLVVSCCKRSHIAIPYGHQDKLNDIPFDKKIKKINFVGAATGTGFYNRQFDNNQRINFCKTMYNNKHVHARICDIGGMCGYGKKAKKYIPHLLVDHIINRDEQLKYRYLLNINGFANAWVRLPWQMASNSVCMFLKPKEKFMDWYYCLFEKEDVPLPFVWVTEDNIIDIKKELDQDDDLCLKYVNQGKDFVSKYLTKESTYTYLTGLFEKINNLSN